MKQALQRLLLRMWAELASLKKEEAFHPNWFHCRNSLLSVEFMIIVNNQPFSKYWSFKKQDIIKNSALCCIVTHKKNKNKMM